MLKKDCKIHNILYNTVVIYKKLITAILIILATELVRANVETSGAEPNSIAAPAAAVIDAPAADPNSLRPLPDDTRSDNTLNAVCGQILNNEFIDDSGAVDYKLLRRKRSQLYSIVREFEVLDVQEYLTWETEDQTAFWINVHNILTLKLITDNYPIEPSRLKMIFYPANSIMQITGARQSNYYNVMGREYSLEEIEENVLELYKDPRVLFALNYAAWGSAPLRNEQYTGKKLETQLDNQVRKMLGRRNGFFIDKSELNLTPIFDWNIKAFVEFYGTNIKYRAHTEQTRAIFNFIEKFKGVGWSNVLESDKFKLKYQNFDWRLNER